MTKRLYLEDSHLTACEATVEWIEKTDAGYDVTLDQTVIFDNAGGQPADTGRLGDAIVLGCDEKDGKLLHHIDRPLTVGQRYPLTLDWARRFDFMQQHTGEHLLSYAAYRHYGVNNVGFHLAADCATIDLDAPLTQEQLSEIVRAANGYVFRDLPVHATLYESEDAIRDLPLRKHAEGVRTPIRLVRIEEADCCTCCAPHCNRTGEVGGIIVTDAVRYKGGMRLTFLCGGRAFAYAEALHRDMDAMARGFSTSREAVLETVARLREEHGRLRRREKALLGALNAYLARDLAANSVRTGKCALIVAEAEDCAPDRLKALALQTLTDERALTVLLSVSGGKLGYVLAATPALGLDMGELCQAVNAAVNGRGGGRGTLAQGAAAVPAALGETVEQLRGYFVRRLASL